MLMATVHTHKNYIKKLSMRNTITQPRDNHTHTVYVRTCKLRTPLRSVGLGRRSLCEKAVQKMGCCESREDETDVRSIVETYQ